MNWIDGIILAVLALILGILVWWRFFKHRGESCSMCEQAPKKDGTRLLKAYRKKYKTSNKNCCR